jgi:hypothetical protein
MFCRYAHGSTPNRWHVDVKLKSTAAVWPPRGDRAVNQFFTASSNPLHLAFGHVVVDGQEARLRIIRPP